MNEVHKMVYIEKNDKPTFLERILNLIKVQENTIIVPINNETTTKQIEKIAQEKFGNLAGLAQQYLFYWNK